MACGDDESGSPSLMANHPAAKGLAELRAGRVREALVWFDRLVELEPNGVPGHFLRAEALDQLGDFEALRALLGDLLRRFPFAEGACRERLALLELRTGNRAAALIELERAIASGWSNVGAVLEDPIGDGLADDPAFAALLQRARANTDAE